MNVIRSRILGFCMGVRRAVDMARQEAGKAGMLIFTLGPLIHNPMVLDDLEKRGIGIIDTHSVSSLPANSTVIIRAHGISPSTEASLSRQGLRIVDATCPRVKANQKKAKNFAENGYWVFLAGEEDHAEIIGIRGYVECFCRDKFRCSVVGNPAEAKAAAAELRRTESAARTVLLGQTTIRAEEYHAIGEEIRKFFPDLEIENTICNATDERQNSLRELCGVVDAIIVVGGKESSNTRRLLSLAVEFGKPAWIAESSKDLPAEIAVYNTVGLCAGASTPDEQIAEIEQALVTTASR